MRRELTGQVRRHKVISGRAYQYAAKGMGTIQAEVGAIAPDQMRRSGLGYHRRRRRGRWRQEYTIHSLRPGRLFVRDRLGIEPQSAYLLNRPGVVLRGDRVVQQELGLPLRGIDFRRQH